MLNDHAAHSPASLALVRSIEDSERRAWTTELVIGEIVFVLSSKSGPGLSPAEIRDALLPLIELPGLQIANKRLYRRAFDLYATTGIDFVDAYHAALLESRGETELYSFDRHFDRVSSLRRIEP